MILVQLTQVVPRCSNVPHPQDLLASACKVQHDNDLMSAAMTMTKTPYPKSLMLTNEQDLRTACNNVNIVVKRDFSNSTMCTFLPVRDRCANHRTETVLQKYAKSEILYEGIECLPCLAWLAKPWMPSLVEKGEIRAFVVGGKLLHAVHTWLQSTGGWTHNFELVDNYTPLKQLK
jgi:hypothetical protein